MRLDELINAPDIQVYHWTNASTLLRIFRTNLVKGDTEHEFNDQKLVGVSTSRNPFFDIMDTYQVAGQKPWRIGFNLQRLRYDHRVIPVRDDQYWRHIRNRRRPEPILFGFKKVGTHWASSDESEELVVGDIYPFWHYVDSIAVEERHIDITALPGETEDDMHLHARSTMTVADQNLLWRLVAGTIYGKRHYEASMLTKMMKNPIRLPDRVQFLLIDRGEKRIVPIRDAYKDNMGFPDKRDDDGIPPFDHDDIGRRDRKEDYVVSKARHRWRE